MASKLVILAVQFKLWFQTTVFTFGKIKWLIVIWLAGYELTCRPGYETTS